MGVLGKRDSYYDRLNPICITTGDLNSEYEIIDTVFAVAFNKETWFKSADPSASFEGVKEQLKQKCRALGGDAVICCQFEYRIAVDSGIFASKQVAEIWAYGTAVKLLQ